MIDKRILYVLCGILAGMLGLCVYAIRTMQHLSESGRFVPGELGFLLGQALLLTALVTLHLLLKR